MPVVLECTYQRVSTLALTQAPAHIPSYTTVLTSLLSSGSGGGIPVSKNYIGSVCVMAEAHGPPTQALRGIGVMSLKVKGRSVVNKNQRQ